MTTSKRAYNSTNRPVGKTPLRAIRIQPDIWDAVKAKAEQNGETVSDIVREAIQQYLAK